MYTIKEVERDYLEYMIGEHYAEISTPMDDMWEKGIIEVSDHFLILNNNEEVGYFVLDANNALLQFFLLINYRLVSDDIFKYILKDLDIEKAYVSTYDSNYLNLCLDNNKSVHVDSLLYKDHIPVKNHNPLDRCLFVIATMKDLDNILEYHHEKVDIHEKWLKEYCVGLIKRKELFLLIHKNEIVGTGELRPSESSPRYANLGVTVSKKYQKIGLGTFILTYMKNLSYEKKLIPICSTTKKNKASQKVIKKSGFYPYHRVMEVVFK